MDLSGKVAVVTGGAGILGVHFCRGLAAAGATVAVVDIDANRVEEVAKSLGNNSAGFVCDVSNSESVKQLVSGIVEKFGRIDVLHNNAATKTHSLDRFFEPFESYELSTWKEVMSVNLDGMFLMAQAVGRQMLLQGGGVIVQTASIYGLVGPDERIYEGSEYMGVGINTPAVYSASKAGVIGLTRWLSTHWAKNNIRVNCLVPGGVSSGQNNAFSELYASRVPMNRMATPDEMVSALLYLASDCSSYVTGHVLAVDGGWTAW